MVFFLSEGQTNEMVGFSASSKTVEPVSDFHSAQRSLSHPGM